LIYSSQLAGIAWNSITGFEANWPLAAHLVTLAFSMALAHFRQTIRSAWQIGSVQGASHHRNHICLCILSKWSWRFAANPRMMLKRMMHPKVLRCKTSFSITNHCGKFCGVGRVWFSPILIPYEEYSFAFVAWVSFAAWEFQPPPSLPNCVKFWRILCLECIVPNVNDTEHLAECACCCVFHASMCSKPLVCELRELH